jgi:hypothetical protein
MDVDSFLKSVSETNRRLPSIAAENVAGRAPETMDALFHLPLLALAVMTIARMKPFRTVVLGRNVARLMEEHFTALRHTHHALEMSLTLRRRCADALAFLEAAGLVSVSPDSQRVVTLSKAGKAHFDRSVRDATDLGLLVRQLRRNQDRVLARLGNDR